MTVIFLAFSPFGAQIKPLLDRFQGIGGSSGTIVSPGTPMTPDTAPSGAHSTARSAELTTPH